LAFTGDDAVLGSGESNGNISLWNTNTGDLIATLSDTDRSRCDDSAPQAEDPVYGVGFSPNGRLLASQDAFGIVRVWDTAEHKLLYSLPLNLLGGGHQVGFSPNGHFLIASAGFPENGAYHSTWLVLDAATGSLLQAFALPGQVAFGFLPGDTLVTAQLFAGRIKTEKWSLRYRFRIPFVSAKPRSVQKSDSILLQAYDNGAIQSLTSLQQSLANYGDAHGAFPENIGEPMQALRMGAITAKDSNTREFGGYRFTYAPSSPTDQARVTSYVLSVRPLLYEQTGTRSFLVDQTGQVHATLDAREAAATDPVFCSLARALQIATSEQAVGGPPNQNAATTDAVPTAVTSQNQSPARSNSLQASAQAEQWASRAEAQFQQADYQGAIQSCDTALGLDPGNSRAKQLKAKVEETMKILGKN
jgi:hypothetical protein